MDATIVLLPGDGIGPEIVSQARRVLDVVAQRFGHTFEMPEHAIGGNAIDAFGDPLPEATLTACRNSQAVLLGAVGGPQWDDPNAKTRPEVGLLRIRKELGLFANLRPTKTWDELLDASPLKREIIEGTDILFVRELTGGIYFGESGRRPHPSGEEAWNTMIYSTGEIERVVRVAAQAARKRRGKLTMVDKANVLESSRLWRQVSERLIKTEFPDLAYNVVLVDSRLWRQVAERVVKTEYPDLQYNVVLVDSMAMHLISKPREFDVVVTENLFGDILTDEASMLPGSLGLLPSASIGSSGPGLFEPIHGSAPDIAGKNVANPLATILAVAMLLRYSMSMNAEADAIEDVVSRVLKSGLRTKDIACSGASVSTTQMGDAVVKTLLG